MECRERRAGSSIAAYSCRIQILLSAPGVDEIYAYGFRNPFRFGFDPGTDKLIVGDVGQNHVEEIDVVQAGKNYGWNKKEGSFLFHPTNGSISPNPASNPALINPIADIWP